MGPIDLYGQKFGRLQVLFLAEERKNKSAVWVCRCDCGTLCRVQSGSLRAGATSSCGCLQIEARIEVHTTHGLTHTPEYKAWASIIQRCTNPRNRDYKQYGGRGITVCPEWSDFKAFYDEIGP